MGAGVGQPLGCGLPDSFLEPCPWEIWAEAELCVPKACWACYKAGVSAGGTLVCGGAGGEPSQLGLGDREKLLVFPEKALGETNAMSMYA